jgi:hypothetical protein
LPTYLNLISDQNSGWNMTSLSASCGNNLWNINY